MSTLNGAAPKTRNRTIIWMTVGSAMIGLSGYLFLSVIGHGRFESATYAALSSTYLLLNILGPGVFVAIEQQSSQAVSHAMALGQDTAVTIRRMSTIAAGLVLAMLLVVAIAAPILLTQVLDNEFGLLLVIAASIVGSAMVFLVRGVFGGQTRFGNYSLTLMVDGGIRLLGCVALAVFDSRSPIAYASWLAIAPVLAAVVAFLTRPGRRNPVLKTIRAGSARLTSDPSWTGLIRGVLWLFVSSVLWMSMANIAPVIVTAMLPTAPDIAAGFSVALVLTRIPLLLMAPIQALFLPRMARFAAAGNVLGFRRDLLKGLALVVSIGIAFIVGCGWLGRWVIATLFGAASDTTSGSDLFWLAVSSSMLMAVMLLQPGLVALRYSGSMVLGWIIGTIVFFGCFVFLPFDPLPTAICAQLAGPVATLTVHSVAIIRAMGRIKVSSSADQTD